MKKKIKIIIVVIIVVISLGILLWSLSPPKSESVSDIVKNPDKFLGKNIQIKGIVENNTIENSTSEITFNLTDEKDNNYKLSITYEGSLPNNFQEGKTIFVKGTLEKDDDQKLLFKADKIIVGCPSKYD